MENELQVSVTIEFQKQKFALSIPASTSIKQVKEKAFGICHKLDSSLQKDNFDVADPESGYTYNDAGRIADLTYGGKPLALKIQPGPGYLKKKLYQFGNWIVDYLDSSLPYIQEMNTMTPETMMYMGQPGYDNSLYHSNHLDHIYQEQEEISRERE